MNKKNIKINTKRVYLDYASVTPIARDVLKVMNEASVRLFANPSSLYSEGVEAKNAVEDGRRKIGKFFGAHPDEIIFTSGGTESDNLAILGTITNYELQNTNKKSYKLPHIISTNIEHSAVMETLKYLEKSKRAEVTYVAVEKDGIVNPKEIKKAIKPNTILITVMYANNEIGTTQPITEIAKEIRHYKKHFSQDPSLQKGIQIYPIFHTDASQAISLLDINVQKLGVDMLTCNGGKIHGPRGIGLLYKKRGIEISKQIYGGSQEFGMRAGTENVPAILGFAKAFGLVEKNKNKDFKKISEIQNYTYQKIIQNFPKVILNGELESRLPSNLNFSFQGIESELLVLELDALGICVSSKSACKSFDVDESYVLSALGTTPQSQQNLATIRLSFSASTTKSDINYLISSLKKIFQKYEHVKNIK